MFNMLVNITPIPADIVEMIAEPRKNLLGYNCRRPRAEVIRYLAASLRCPLAPLALNSPATLANRVHKFIQISFVHRNVICENYFHQKCYSWMTFFHS